MLRNRRDDVHRYLGRVLTNSIPFLLLVSRAHKLVDSPGSLPVLPVVNSYVLFTTLSRTTAGHQSVYRGGVKGYHSVILIRAFVRTKINYCIEDLDRGIQTAGTVSDRVIYFLAY
jgi:hypothetical protein